MLFWVFDSIQSVIKYFWIVLFPVLGSLDLLMIFDTIQNFPWKFLNRFIEALYIWFWLSWYVFVFFESYQFSFGFHDTIQTLAIACLKRIKLHLKISWYDSYQSSCSLDSLILQCLNHIMFFMIRFKLFFFG